MQDESEYVWSIRSGGLAMLWRKDIEVSLRSYTERYIDVEAELLGQNIRVTGVYGEPEVSSRRDGFEALKLLGNGNMLPWICLGDFNEVLQSSEATGTRSRSNRQMAYFRDFVEDCNLEDMNWVGPKYTWNRLRVAPHTQRARLDRALNNSQWKAIFELSRVSNIYTLQSDHHLLHVQFAMKHPRSNPKKKPLRFEALWLKEEECEKIVEAAWNNSTSDLPERLTECSLGLLRWGGRKLTELQGMIKKLKEKIESKEREPSQKR